MSHEAESAKRALDREAAECRMVLVVDDDAELRASIVEYLKSQGFAVAEADNGLEALLSIKRLRPNAVIMDISVPRLGGLDALKRIRAVAPETALIVVARTDDAALKGQALSMGATAFHAKPFNFDDLLAGLRNAKGNEKPNKAAESLPGGYTGHMPFSSSGRILVVDDEAEIRMVLEEFLGNKGYHVGSAGDGTSAVRAVIDDAPDVILLDINMPKLNGLEALSAIRAINPNTKVIMISAQSDLEVAKRSLTYGAFDYVAKPFDLEYVATGIEAALLTNWLHAGAPAHPEGEGTR